MKTLVKISVSFTAVLLLAIIAVFAINATDEKQTELTQQMLTKFPAQEGFSLKEFKRPQANRVSAIDFSKYEDYTKDPAKYDALLKEHDEVLGTLGRALSVGHVAVNPDESIYDGLFIYQKNEHLLFLVFLSQQIKLGKTTEALTLLEKSNRFLVSMASTPQTYITKLIGLALLNTNAEFTKSLLESKVVKSIPSSLKESFNIVDTPEQMWQKSSQKEFLLASSALNGPLNSDIFDLQNPNKALNSVLGWLYPKLLRPNETLNIMSSGYTLGSSPECSKVNSEACTEAYSKLTGFTATNFFINPVGRSLAAIILPKLYNVRYKFDATKNKIKETTASF